MDRNQALVLWLEDVGSHDVALVGGKNASLGRLLADLVPEGINVPGGFAVTARAFDLFVDDNDLRGLIAEAIETHRAGGGLHHAGARIRAAFAAATMPASIRAAVEDAYAELGRRAGRSDVDVAARSSATAEDLPEASFAGQQETFLNVRGPQALMSAVQDCFASLFTDRAIAYREVQGIEHSQVALSVAVQRMVRSDLGAAGVIFTLDTESGFPGLVVLNGSWGLGEYVVKGTVNPDEWRVFKGLLDEHDKAPIISRRKGDKGRKLLYGTAAATLDAVTSPEERAGWVIDDAQVLKLARWAAKIEQVYGCPMDLEWALDGQTDELFIVQARPETVHSRKGDSIFSTFELSERGAVLARGVAVGSAIATGNAFVLDSVEQADEFEDGGILVTTLTDPDWVPVMKRASGIVTDRGGRTSHAAIVSRELGVAAVVGTGTGTSTIADGQDITLSCAEGPDGFVYDGTLAFREIAVDLTELPESPVEILLNVADPAAALRWWRLPTSGVGLARLEFIIDHVIQIHPMALVKYGDLEHAGTKRRIDELTEGYPDKTEYFVDRLSEGIATIAASQFPNPVLVRMSDFKTNEYADLIGGHEFEPLEENPMLGFRGASRYYSPEYREGFALECAAIKRVREVMGFSNVRVMIPFCRTLEEADMVLDVMAEEGLKRGVDGLQIWVMAEVPSNVILAKEFAERFDGFSIGSNDLTQLVLGADRDAAHLAKIFDERDPAVTRMIELLLETAHANGTPVGICGQAPSDHPEFAQFLVERGIDSISLNPDSVPATIRRLGGQTD